MKDEVYLYNLKDGKRITRIAEEFVGEIAIYGKREQPWFFATLTSFTNPSLIYQYRFDDAVEEEEKWRLLRATEVKGLATNDFVSKQVWYESKDGTKVPMFIVRHKDTPLDGTAPGYQYGLFAQTRFLTRELNLGHRIWRFQHLHQPVLQRSHLEVRPKVQGGARRS